MRTLKRTLMMGATLCGILGLLVVPAQALDFDFAGTFQYDNDRLFVAFTVGGMAPSSVTVFSSSWLFGEPPLGAGPGGFDPMLGIWTAAGDLVFFQDDGGFVGSTFSNGVPYSHGAWDSYYRVDLDPGSYIASITQYDNFNNGDELSAGFHYDGDPYFTRGYGGSTQPMFNGVWDDDDPRTNNWAFHIVNVAAAEAGGDSVVPEPGTVALLGSGLTVLAGVARRRGKK